MTDTECAHGLPGHLPELLPRAPDCARFVSRRSAAPIPSTQSSPRQHRDRWRTPRAAAPPGLLDNELHSLQPPAPDFPLDAAPPHTPPALPPPHPTPPP